MGRDAEGPHVRIDDEWVGTAAGFGDRLVGLGHLWSMRPSHIIPLRRRAQQKSAGTGSTVEPDHPALGDTLP